MSTSELQPLQRRPPALGLPAENLASRLGLRYRLVLIAVAALIAADQAAIQPLLSRMNAFAPVINTAGRQRMLSQKLAKAALAMTTAESGVVKSERREELRQALNEFAESHYVLQHGAPTRSVRKIHSPAIESAWREIKPHFATIESAARVLSSEAAPEESQAASVTSIVNAEAKFLKGMERVVALIEGQAELELWRLRTLAMAIAASILALIIALGAMVVRPAARAIGQQVDQLEWQVARRTRELDETLISLRHEVSQRERTESRNRTLAAQLAHADRVHSLDMLAAGLAHELNQPLGAIANYASACELTIAGPWSEQAAARMRQHLRTLSEATLRAGAIVRRIRNYVRPGTSQVAPIALNSLIAEVVDLCRPEIMRMGVDVALDLPDDEILVHADAIQIQQVLVNLIQNALQAMASAPSERRRLGISVRAANERVQVDVSDGGPGLDETDADLVFAPFRTTKSDGLGIGLSICRAIIEEHQGAIWAASLPHHGAQFSFVLPRAAEYVRQPA